MAAAAALAGNRICSGAGAAAAATCGAGGGADVVALVGSLGWTLLSASLSNPAAAGGVGVFVSPVSVFYALMLALNAAGPDSLTQREMLQLLSGNHTSTPACTSPAGATLSESQLNTQLSELMHSLSSEPSALNPTASSQQPGQGHGEGGTPSIMLIANGIFTRSSVKEDYAAAMASLFNATTRTVSSAAEINDWVNKSTRGEIPTLLDPSASFDTVLANTLYFKGLWRKPFNKGLTQPRVFHASDGDRQVKMMRVTLEQDNRVQVETLPSVYRAVVLPYQGRQYSAVAVLPDPGVSLQDTVTALSSAASQANKQVQTPRKTIVTMPKFRAEASLQLKDTLQHMGMKVGFTGAADFSRASQGLFISEVLHKTVVDVDEEGTVAAAVTGIMLTRSVAPQPEPPVELTFDRPFLFIIRHVPSGVPVFVGAVRAPPVAR